MVGIKNKYGNRNLFVIKIFLIFYLSLFYNVLVSMKKMEEFDQLSCDFTKDKKLNEYINTQELHNLLTKLEYLPQKNMSLESLDLLLQKYFFSGGGGKERWQIQEKEGANDKELKESARKILRLEDSSLQDKNIFYIMQKAQKSEKKICIVVLGGSIPSFLQRFLNAIAVYYFFVKNKIPTKICVLGGYRILDEKVDKNADGRRDQFLGLMKFLNIITRGWFCKNQSQYDDFLQKNIPRIQNAKNEIDVAKFLAINIGHFLSLDNCYFVIQENLNEGQKRATTESTLALFVQKESELGKNDSYSYLLQSSNQYVNYQQIIADTVSSKYGPPFTVLGEYLDEKNMYENFRDFYPAEVSQGYMNFKKIDNTHHDNLSVLLDTVSRIVHTCRKGHECGWWKCQ